MKKRFSFKSAIVASVGATIALIFSMALFGINITKSLGATAGQEGFNAYVLGSFLCFSAGTVYGIIYALVFEPWLKNLPNYLAGAIYSLLPFFLSILFLQSFLEGVRFIFQDSKVPLVHQPEVPGEGSKGKGVTFINHLVYGVVLSLIYRPKNKKDRKN